jgi:hypothetical protein
MMIRSGLTFFVCLLFVIGINQRMQGAELKDFQTNMEKVKESLVNAKNLKESKLDKVNKKLFKAEGREIGKLYVEKVEVLGEMCDEYSKIESFLGKAISNMDDAESWGKDGEQRQPVAEQIKGNIEAITANMEMMDNVYNNFSAIPDVEGLEHMKVAAAACKVAIKSMKERFSENVELLQGHLGSNTDKPNANDPEVIKGMRISLQYYKNFVALNKAVYVMQFYQTDATGKYMLEVAKLEELKNQAFNGMPLDEYIEDIIKLPGSTKFENDLLKQDLQNIYINYNKGKKSLDDAVRKKIEDHKKAPKPGVVTHEYFCDDNSNHSYYFDQSNERWFWVVGGDLRGERHYMPFDYKAGTGEYIECKDGKWYSFAPIHNGASVQIFFDGEDEN